MREMARDLHEQMRAVYGMNDRNDVSLASVRMILEDLIFEGRFVGIFQEEAARFLAPSPPDVSIECPTIP